jgi:hypothetical protein
MAMWLCGYFPKFSNHNVSKLQSFKVSQSQTSEVPTSCAVFVKNVPPWGGNTRADNLSGSTELYFKGYDICQLAPLGLGGRFSGLSVSWKQYQKHVDFWPLLAPSGCHLGGIGASILILWGIFFISGVRWEVILTIRGHPGTPWEQQDGYEVVGNTIFIDLGVILGSVYASFLNTGRSKPHSFPGLIQKAFYIHFCVEISNLGHLDSRLSHGRYCKNQLSTEIVFYEIRGRNLWLFGRSWYSFFWFFRVLKIISKTYDFWSCPMRYLTSAGLKGEVAREISSLIN